MSFDMTTFGITLVYVLILQPFALLQILPFRRVLPRVQKRHILLFWCLLIALEVGLITAIVSLDVFPLRQTAYWRLGYLVWIPQFVLALYAPLLARHHPDSRAARLRVALPEPSRFAGEDP